MEKKEIKPGKVFWVSTLICFLLSTLAMVIIGVWTGKTSRIFSTPGALFLFEAFWISMFCGAFFAFMAWCGKRNQKMKEKDEVNDLMRQYLEKKLKEEMKDESTK